MKPSRLLSSAAGAAAGILALTAAAVAPQIERLDLRKMVFKTSGAVAGEITAKRVLVIDDPAGGEGHYFTELTVEGVSLATGEAVEVQACYRGGFLDDERGAYDSEAPAEHETVPGTRVIVFYEWVPNMTGGVPGNLIYAGHGGLYTTFDGRKGRTIVQGRGAGYAVEKNAVLGELAGRVEALAQEKAKKNK